MPSLICRPNTSDDDILFPLCWDWSVSWGRAYAYALAAAGQARVDRAIETLRRVFSITLALMDVSSIADLKERGSHLIFKQ
ncbi:alpha-hydroxy-acid oxidizing protein [Rhizobium sp. LjRoot258]|uniref:alpha-hydroxy-acid oxidizing protein n=1 Tax=Rhizobium sp. LjRoot258 TaxID=3342299 RepID=UPI003F4FC879